MFPFDPTDFLPFFALSIPIIAIIGGITAGIVRMIHRQRSFELIQRERIAAIERGIDPDKLGVLPHPFMYDDRGNPTDPRMSAERRRQGLLVGGLVTLFVGFGLAIFLRGVAGDDGHGNAWMVGVIPISVGVALLLSSFLIRPINGSSEGPPHPPQH